LKHLGKLVDKYRAAHRDGRNEWGELVTLGVYFYAFEAGGLSPYGEGDGVERMA